MARPRAASAPPPDAAADSPPPVSAAADSPPPPVSAADGGDYCIGCCAQDRPNPRPAKTRGNCDACDMALRRRIRDPADPITEEQALALGLWLPRKKAGRPRSSGMHDAIDQAMEGRPR